MIKPQDCVSHDPDLATHNPDLPHIITGERALDAFMAEAKRVARDGFGHLAQFLNAYKYVPDSTPPDDADSAEFAEWQMQLWRTISGRDSYSPEIDERDHNVAVTVDAARHFPYSTNDPSTIGNYFGAIGLIIKALDLRAGDRVVEFGVGWGHTTLNLARCGYKVTAIDIEGNFLELLRLRAERESLNIRAVRGDFLDLPVEEASYDAALFFECFHHCIRFKELIERLRAVIRPGGKIVFCGESFYGEWFDYPWGVRLDGHSVWAIRNFGWMELGFRESYITALLERLDFNVKKIESPVGPIGTIFTATARAR